MDYTLDHIIQENGKWFAEIRQHKGTENKIKVLFVFFFNISSKKENLFI